MTAPAGRAVAVVSVAGARALRRGHPWCYRTELVEPPAVESPGEVVLVVDKQRNPIGQALYARKSPLALRLLTRGPPEQEPIDEAFFRRRLAACLQRRRTLVGRDAYRVVHGEADLLPGLFVDRYGSALVMQTLSEGMDARKAMLAALCADLFGADRVVCRDDGSGRDFEKLPRETRWLVGGGDPKVRYHEGKTAFETDLLEDSKTGSFLDQVDNHVRAGELAAGDALDCFSYHGGFALALAGSCSSVLAVEQDATAAARIEVNAKLNGRANVKVECANAFDVLKRFDKEGRKFDTVVLDPPGFVKRKEGLPAALRAYHELNLRGLRLLRPGGLFVTCSCSGKLTRPAFEQMLLSAAEDAKRPVQILERRGAGLDHPGLFGVPETDYLKAFFLRVL